MEDFELNNILVCPYDRGSLVMKDGKLVCENNHTFNIVEGVPVLLREDVLETLWVAKASLNASRNIEAHSKEDPFFVDTLGISEKDRIPLKEKCKLEVAIDPVVQELVVATCGNLYRGLKSNLDRYPIPEITLDQTKKGCLLLDVGCNWGRWCVSASRKGYRVVGIDPSLGAILAAKRLAEHMGEKISFVVADSRYLPFKENIFNVVYSYSVFQHFSKSDFLLSMDQIKQVLKSEGDCLIQMANKFGPISIFHQLKRGFSSAKNFQVRYWSVKELGEIFSTKIGKVQIRIDTFFGLGAQRSDMEMMSPLVRLGFRLSEVLKKLSSKFPFIVYFADSIFFLSKKNNK